MCRRALCILECHFPTPSEEVVTKEMKPRKIIPGKVGRVDTERGFVADVASDRFENRTGETASIEQLQQEVEDMREEGLL